MVKISPKIKKAIINYIDEINNICAIEKVILFGSYASGYHSSRSDIDLAIFSKNINDDNRLEFMKIFFMKIDDTAKSPNLKKRTLKTLELRDTKLNKFDFLPCHQDW